MPDPDRARSFGALAEDYHRHRPGYPAAALDWALEPLGAGRLVLDLGAGTGKLTESLAERPGVDVVAVEPDPAMLGVLRAVLPTVSSLAGSAEVIPLPDTSVDAVLVGQAFHWFDAERATAEIVRVLRPGGVFAALWNGEDLRVEWVDGYYRAVGRRRARRDDHLGRAADPPGPAEHPGLTPAVRAVFSNPIRVTADALLRTLATYSWISTLPESERTARIAAGRSFLAGRAETSGADFALPLRTKVLRAVRT